ncbi:MAG: DUF58 domain-containing protein [Verrucomicrobiales bacterium]
MPRFSPRTPAPSRRLLWLAALAVAPALTLAFYRETWLLPGIGIALATGVVAAVDLVRGRRRIGAFSAELPDSARATKGRLIELPVAVTADPPDMPGAPPLRLALRWGEAFAAESEAVGIEAPAAGKPARGVMAAQALRRGRFRIGAVYAECRSPLGLWDCRGVAAADCEARIFPSLAADRRALAALFLRRGDAGLHAVRQVGKGRDFEQLREYQPGDDYSDIYWKATAKRGYPVTKMYQIERTQEVYVAIDHSRLAARPIHLPEELAASGTQSAVVTTQLERFLQCALAMGLAAETQGDHFGLASFADRADAFIRAGSGKAHYNACREAIYALEPLPKSPDFEEAFMFFKTHLTRRALLIVLTDLSDPLTAEAFTEAARLISRHHVVLVNMVQPENARPLFSAAAAESGVPADLHAELGGHFLWQELLEVGKRLGQQNIGFATPKAGSLTAEVVSQYLNVKRRQLL